MRQIPQFSPNTKRLRILNRIAQCIGKMEAGAEVTLENRAVYTFRYSAGLIAFNFVDITSLGDEEFPAIFILPQHETNFDTDADGWTADVPDWPVSIYLSMKTGPEDDPRTSIIVEMMETLFQDVCVALLSDFNMGMDVDTVLTITALAPNPLTDPGYAQSAVIAKISTTQNFFK